MRRGSYRSRRNTIRRRRPTNRVIQAGTVSLPAVGQTTGYMFIAVDPCTATNFQLDIGISGTGSNTVAYALIYVPDGYNVNTMTYPSVPQQTCMSHLRMCCWVASSQIQQWKTGKQADTQEGCRQGIEFALIFFNTTSTAQIMAFELNFYHCTLIKKIYARK